MSGETTCLSKNSIQSGTKKHYGEIDIAKGMGIVLVVLGHALKQTGETNSAFEILLSIIYSFHMPLFFMLSGFVSVKILNLSNMQERWSYIKERAFRLLVPYFVMGIIYMPVKYILSSYAVKKYDFTSMWRILIGDNPDVSLWFLYALFLSSLLCGLFLTAGNLKAVILVSFLCSAAAYAADISARWPKYFFFFVLGILLRTRYEKVRDWFKNSWIVLGAVAIFVAGNVALYDTGCTLLTMITSLSGIFCSMVLAYLLNETNGWMKQLFAYLGRYSMDIYILSEPFLTVSKLLFWNILHLNYLLSTVLCLGAGLLLPIPISLLILRKVKLFRMAFLGICEK